MTADLQPFTTGTARNVKLRCARGHEWQSVEARSESLTRWPQPYLGSLPMFTRTTSYVPGACPTCHGEPVTIDPRRTEGTV